MEFGFIPSQIFSEADIIVFNTCCIRDTAEKKIFGHIGQLKKLKAKHPDKVIAICGCLTQQDRAGGSLREKYPFVDIVLGTHNIHLLGEKVFNFSFKKPVVEICDNAVICEKNHPFRTSGTNAWINIIYGCDNYCTYCIVPYVRGRQRSRKVDDVLNEATRLVSEGYKEITLLGQNVNSYGQDLNPSVSFATLLSQLCAIKADFRLRFMTSHPKDISQECIDLIASQNKLCKSIHLPVQSGSNDILKAMNRKYTREHYLELINRIRSAIPDCAITTDIIVGFPGETEDDFLATLDLVRQAEFSAAFTFVYSKRRGTVADKMENQVPPEVKKERIQRLIDLQNSITKKISANYHDGIFTILTEDKSQKHSDTYSGRTDCNKLVNFSYPENLMGKFVRVKITKSQSATLWGKVIEVLD